MNEYEKWEEETRESWMRRVDVFVAERVMGLEVFTSRDDYFAKGCPHPAEFDANVNYPAYYYQGYATAVPYYSTQIADAWLVVEKMHSASIKTNADKWIAELSIDGEGNYWSWNDTAPLAICLAALKTKENNDD